MSKRTRYYTRHTPNTINPCGKVIYEDRESAEAGAKERMREIGGGPNIRPYWCPACFKYHLTSS